jgi:succinate dehydrogenase hydrophobic anchor subunit
MEQQTTTARVALKYGVVTAIAHIVYVTILYITGQHTNKSLLSLSLVITIVGMIAAMKEFKEDSSGFMSYTQGLGIGTMMAAVAGFISGVYNYIYTSFIDQTITPQILEKARRDMEARGSDDAQIEKGMWFVEMVSRPTFTFALNVLSAIIGGFIFALILSAIMKKDKPVFD